MKENKEGLKLKAKIIASLQDNYIDILAGYDLGQLNGEIIQRIELRHFPIDCRMPNTHIIVTYKDRKSLEILKIELDNNEQ